MRYLRQNVTNVTYLAVLYCALLCCTTMFSSCSKDNNETDTLETELVNRVWEYSKTNRIVGFAQVSIITTYSSKLYRLLTDEFAA